VNKREREREREIERERGEKIEDKTGLAPEPVWVV